MDSFVLSSPHSVEIYPIRLRAGEKLKLKKRLNITNKNYCFHEPGEIWTVLIGCVDDLDIIWLMQPDGELHTWDGSIFDTFERIASSP